MYSLLELYTNVEFTLKSMEIPPRPVILDKIMCEARQEEPDFLKLSSLIGEDVCLSAGLITTVNSPFFGLRRKITTVRDALVMLGLEVASRMVSGILLRHVFPKRLDLEDLWDNSIKIALLSQWLANELGRADGVRRDDAYTFGLFRDCGMAVMALNHADYRKTWDCASREKMLAFTEIEDQAFRINHAVVGSRLAMDWYLADSMVLGMLFHHALDLQEQTFGTHVASGQRLIALSHLAEKLLQDDDKVARNCEWDKLGAKCLEILRLDEKDLDELRAASLPFLNRDLPKLMF